MAVAWGILGADWASTWPGRRRAALVRAVTAHRALPAEGARRCSEAQLDSLLESSVDSYATQVRASLGAFYIHTQFFYQSDR